MGPSRSAQSSAGMPNTEIGSLTPPKPTFTPLFAPYQALPTVLNGVTPFYDFSSALSRGWCCALLRAF
eukprot:2230861-Alexandrium_andersonii.AAC.1